MDVDTVFGACESVGQAADEDGPTLEWRKKGEHIGPLGHSGQHRHWS